MASQETTPTVAVRRTGPGQNGRLDPTRILGSTPTLERASPEVVEILSLRALLCLETYKSCRQGLQVPSEISWRKATERMFGVSGFIARKAGEDALSHRAIDTARHLG